MGDGAILWQPGYKAEGVRSPRNGIVPVRNWRQARPIRKKEKEQLRERKARLMGNRHVRLVTSEKSDPSKAQSTASLGKIAKKNRINKKTKLVNKASALSWKTDEKK